MARSLSVALLLAAILSAGCTAQLLKIAGQDTEQDARPAAVTAATLDAECQRISEIYPLLMMAVMLEGPMDCGIPHVDTEPVPCDQWDTEEEKAARAHRLQVRKMQEAAAKEASDACDVYEENKNDETAIQNAIESVKRSRATDNGRLPERSSD